MALLKFQAHRSGAMLTLPAKLSTAVVELAYQVITTVAIQDRCKWLFSVLQSLASCFRHQKSPSEIKHRGKDCCSSQLIVSVPWLAAAIGM